LTLVSRDVIYRDEAGSERQVEWVTEQDVDLAQRISQIAAEQSPFADPRSIITIELALDTRTPPRWLRCGDRRRQQGAGHYCARRPGRQQCLRGHVQTARRTGRRDPS